MRISDWSSDVCSSDLTIGELGHCPLHVRELLVQKAAQAIQFVLVAEILRRDDFVIGGRPDVIIELRCQFGGWAVRATRHHALFTNVRRVLVTFGVVFLLPILKVAVLPVAFLLLRNRNTGMYGKSVVVSVDIVERRDM